MKIAFNTRNTTLALSVITILSALSACGSSPKVAETVSPPPPTTAPATAPPSSTAPVSMDPAYLYANTCAKCHDINEIAPGISGMSATELAQFIAGHVTIFVMTDGQRAILANYLLNTSGEDG